jgi:glycosyltransferase involved in cell wall biosynthesis
MICFSHLRWNFVYQRPQHLMKRFAKHQCVFFIEEPEHNGSGDQFSVTKVAENIYRIVPSVNSQNEMEIRERMQAMVYSVMATYDINDYWIWYYTPMALPYTSGLKPQMTIFDCMDELNAFKNPPLGLKQLENTLLKSADIVFTGGNYLFENKQKARTNDIYCFPSSIDAAHFKQARSLNTDPGDQIRIPHPRIGYFGVIDERMNLNLVEQVALRKPEWHFIFVGPVVKISTDSLPVRHNIHYLGMKDYEHLPEYIAGWDIAMMPFAQNESTQFISPTKTPEYLASGKAVVSTPVRDVVKTYGDLDGVHIAADEDQFIKAIQYELDHPLKARRLKKIDDMLSLNSWDKTWAQMFSIIKQKQKNKTSNKEKKESIYV